MTRFIFIPIILCFISLAVVSNVYGQQRYSANLDKRVSVNFKEYTLKQALRLLSEKYKILIGFEPHMNCDEADVRLNLTFSNMPLHAVLDSIVAADSRYVWANNDGVINVSPRKSSGLLTVSIPQFGVKEAGLEDLGPLIVSLPVINARLSQLGLRGNTAYQYDGPKRQPVDITMQVSNISFRDLLNEILRRGYTTFWTLNCYGADPKYLSIEF